MKTGILTFHRALNYGAFLQAYATKSFLSSCGYEAEMVDYWPKEHADYVNRRRLTAKGVSGKCKQAILYLLSKPLFHKRTRKMERLRERYLEIGPTPAYRSGAELAQTDYDVVVYGSDQIWWNHAIYSDKIAYDDTYWGYYLPAKTKRVAYAPSMGIIDIREEDKAFISKSLLNFDSLSTRETTLRDALLPYTDKDIQVVLDPVFLPDKDFWLRQIPKRLIEVPYLLYYSLIPSKEAHNHAVQMAKAKGLRLIEVTAKVRDFRPLPNLIQTADALEFLSLIHYADYVVSTSFHGTAFSIILEKQFCVVGQGNRSGRVLSLLGQLGIRERYTEDPASLGIIDYEPVRERLIPLQKASREYLLSTFQKQ
jgi:hypothetical protein